MARTRVYTDEDVAHSLAIQLRHHGYDAISCRDAGNHNQEFTDTWQLEYATSMGRAIVTRNAIDFIKLDKEWKDAGREHAGIICLDKNPPVAAMVERLRNHVDTVPAEDQYNVLLWASTKPQP